ncbi:hypothetical protein HGA64_04205, partial [Candidatus Falkowbacteria bacterium]|nr:hypothetical protein [Candidatus Falkowbacteria bacterium]
AKIKLSSPDTVEVEVPRELHHDQIKKEWQTEKDLFDVIALYVGYYTNKARGHKVDVGFRIK